MTSRMREKEYIKSGLHIREFVAVNGPFCLRRGMVQEKRAFGYQMRREILDNLSDYQLIRVCGSAWSYKQKELRN